MVDLFYWDLGSLKIIVLVLVTDHVPAMATFALVLVILVTCGRVKFSCLQVLIHKRRTGAVDATLPIFVKEENTY
jgi:hypothetical protein